MKVAQISIINGAIIEGTAMRVAGLSSGLNGIGHSVTTICASGSEKLPGSYLKVNAPLMRRLVRLHDPGSFLGCLSSEFRILDAASQLMLAPLSKICLDAVRSHSILHCHQHWAASVAERGRKPGAQKLLFDYHGMILQKDARGSIIEDTDDKSYSRMLKWERHIFKMADGISFVSTLLRDRIADSHGLDKEKTFIIPDGVDFAHISQNWNESAVNKLRHSWIADHGTVVMYVGSLDSLHGGDYLLEVIRELHECIDADMDIRFVIVGNGPLAEKFTALQTESKGKLVYYPSVSYQMLPTFLAAADILVVPHPRTLFMDSIESGKLLTYLASGKPTVVTRLTSSSRFLDDGHNAILCEPDCPSTMVDGIRRLVVSESLQRRIGLSGASLVRDKCDWLAVARVATDVYHEIMNR